MMQSEVLTSFNLERCDISDAELIHWVSKMKEETKPIAHTYCNYFFFLRTLLKDKLFLFLFFPFDEINGRFFPHGLHYH